jgi:hypothetical protein
MAYASHPHSKGSEASAPSAGTFARDEKDEVERISVAPIGSSLELFAKLIGAMAEPYALVYVLHECYTFRPEGRYQAPHPLSAVNLGAFLTSFSDFLEEDGRHSLFVLSGSEPSVVELDRRGVVTAFGPIGKWPSLLTRLGLSEGTVAAPPRKPRIPAHDQSEARILAAVDWQWNSLELGDFDLP